MDLEISKIINSGTVKILVKTNCRKTEITSYDTQNNALKVSVNAKPENNEANKEIIKFFSKLLKKKVSIKSGLRSKQKLLLIE